MLAATHGSTAGRPARVTYARPSLPATVRPPPSCGLSRSALCRVVTHRRHQQRLRLGCSASFSTDAPSGLQSELKEAVDKFVQENAVVLFMKGTRQFPQCGFSNTCVQILNTLNCPYETVNILEDERLRSGMKEYSQWPTFPQVYIGGEFFGGCDIMIESYTKGELPEVVEAALNA